MRIVHCFLILAALAILLKNVYSDSSNNTLANANTVESYTLAVTWPPGYCSGTPGIACKINPVPTEFKIHGLWPNPNGVPSTEDFDANKIATLTTELNKNWPNLGSAQQQIVDNLLFWRHEWTTHGKFSELGLRDYFEKTLELFENAGQGLKAKLAAEAIKPSAFGDPYKLKAIKDALKKINGGFSVTVLCNARNPTKEKQIQEVQFKFTKDFQKQNNVASTTCGTSDDADVKFPV